MPPDAEPRQKRPGALVRSRWFQYSVLAALFGVSTFVDPHPSRVISSVFFLFGATWEMELYRRFGFFGMMMRQVKQVPAYLAWAAISPACWIIYLATDDPAYRESALGGLLVTIPAAVILAFISHPKLRVGLREMELRDEQGPPDQRG